MKFFANNNIVISDEKYFRGHRSVTEQLKPDADLLANGLNADKLLTSHHLILESIFFYSPAHLSGSDGTEAACPYGNLLFVNDTKFKKSLT